MRWLHPRDIRQRYGYVDDSDPRRGWRFMRWLFTRAWLGLERPSVLFDHAVAWLRAQKVVLPGSSVLERDVARARDRANERLWCLLARDLTPAHRQQLDALLAVPPAAHLTRFEQLRRLPATPSGQGLLDALAHLDTLRDLPPLPPLPRRLGLNRLHSLARLALTAKVQTLARLADTRRAATLRAALHVLMALAHDTVIDLLDEVFTALVAEATKAGTHTRIRTLRSSGRSSGYACTSCGCE
jgi:hypothetical protein